MDNNFTLPIEVKDGKMSAKSYLRLADWLLGYTGKLWATYDKREPQRSSQFNRWFWGYYFIPLVCKPRGYVSADEQLALYQTIKDELGYFKDIEVQVKGKASVARVYRECSKLPTGQFMEFVQRVEVFTGVVAPQGDKPY